MQIAWNSSICWRRKKRFPPPKTETERQTLVQMFHNKFLKTERRGFDIRNQPCLKSIINYHILALNFFLIHLQKMKRKGIETILTKYFNANITRNTCTKNTFKYVWKSFSPQFGVGGMIYWPFGKPIHAPVKEKIDCEQNSKFGSMAKSIVHIWLALTE